MNIMIGITVWSSMDFANNDIFYGRFEFSDVGEILVGVIDDSICYLGIEGSAVDCLTDLQRRYSGATFSELSSSRLSEVAAIVERGYYGGGEVRLTVCGTIFQAEVWMALCGVGFGERVTYGELTRRMGLRGVRAVASAVARNPVSLLIPCHRVVRGDGIGNYFWGTDTKIRILSLEKSSNS